MEEGLAERLVQIGIRTLTPHQRQQVDRFGVEVIDMQSFQPKMDLKVGGPVYLSLDMDCLDPAYAPGVSHLEAGGMNIREVLSIVHQLKDKLVGVDLVEFNPKRDIGNITAYAAAKFLKEILSQMVDKDD